MRYYKINRIWDKKVIGNVDFQANKFLGSYNYWGSNSVWNIPPAHNCNFEIDLSRPILVQDKAKITDVISSHLFRNFRGMSLISKEFYSFLKMFSLQENRTFAVELSHKRKILNSHLLLLLCTIDNPDNIIDFSQTILFKTFKGEKVDTFTVSNYEKLNDAFDNLGQSESIKTGKLVLSSNFKLDFFYIRRVTKGTIVSERLKNAIEEHGFTGMEFKLMEHIVKEEEF